MPVRHPRGGKRGPVLALAAEIAAWLQSMDLRQPAVRITPAVIKPPVALAGYPPNSLIRPESGRSGTAKRTALPFERHKASAAR